jgi:hypothetical protein
MITVDRVLLCFDWYFRPRALEVELKVYERIGIKGFRKFVLSLGKAVSRAFRVRNEYLLSDLSKEAIVTYERQTRVNEAQHLLIGVIIPSLLFIPPVVIEPQGNDTILKLVFALLLVSNIYPILLQRYTRARIHRILRIAERL